MIKPATIITCALAAAVHCNSAAAMDLAVYRALYEFEPARIDQSSSTKPVDGRLAYEVRGSECAGFTIDSRFANRFIDGEQGSRLVDLQSSTFESSDGLQMEITQKQQVNKDPADDSRISVSRDAATAEGRGQVKGDKPKSFTLATDILFPTAHQKKLLALAQSGATRDVSTVYDGSDGEKQYRIVTFIGKRRPPGSYESDVSNPVAKDLKTQSSWSFQLGYYPLDDKQAEAPEFQATFNMYENGVSTEMLFDYGNYAMRGKISRLELLPAETCTDKASPAQQPESKPQ